MKLKFNPFTHKMDWVIDDPWLVAPVEEYWDISGGLPVDPAIGDRYISDGTDTGLGWYDNYIYEWDGTEWIESIPVEGWVVWLLFELVFWVFFSGGWMEVGSGTYVPYVGATLDVDLGTHDLTTSGIATTGGVVFPAADPGVAGAWWDNAGTLTRSAG